MTQLLGQTVIVLGGSAGIGFATARLAREQGADVIITGRDPDRLQQAATDLGARASAAFDATDIAALETFFAGLDGPIDHVMVAAGSAYYAPLPELDFDRAHHSVEEHLWLPLHVARLSIGRIRPGGSLLLMSGTGARRPAVGLALATVLSVGLPAMVGGLALELAPIRVNLIAPGFVDTPLSATLLGADLDARRTELAATLPIRRVIGPDDVAALAVHVMTNTALTGSTYDIDGGQSLVTAH